MFKKSCVAAFALLSILTVISPAQTRRSGIGLILIEPTGLSGKSWLSRSTALQGSAGWSSEKDNRLYFSADFIFFHSLLQSDRNLNLELYLGIGGRIVFRDNDQAGFRFPIGVDFLLRKAPFNFFFEIAPTFNLSEVKLFGAVGFRYLFGQ